MEEITIQRANRVDQHPETDHGGHYHRLQHVNPHLALRPHAPGLQDNPRLWLFVHLPTRVSHRPNCPLPVLSQQQLLAGRHLDPTNVREAHQALIHLHKVRSRKLSPQGPSAFSLGPLGSSPTMEMEKMARMILLRDH
jgi:hypothetical protein